MPLEDSRRGRPKGSGLDDSSQLRQIADLLEADPALKPTTAIKAIGVSDPSTIRRLREKLKIEPLARSGGDDKRAGMLSAAPPAAKSGSGAQPAKHHSTTSSTAIAEAVVSATPVAEVAWLTQWYAFGLSAVSSTFEAQMAMMNNFLQTPQVESALRQQLLFNEVAKALCPKRSGVRTYH